MFTQRFHRHNNAWGISFHISWFGLLADTDEPELAEPIRKPEM